MLTSWAQANTFDKCSPESQWSVSLNTSHYLLTVPHPYLSSPSLKPSGEFPQSGVPLNLSSLLIQTFHFCLCLRKWSRRPCANQLSLLTLLCYFRYFCVFSVCLDVLWKHCGSVCGCILQSLFFLFSLDILRPKWQELLNSKKVFF